MRRILLFFLLLLVPTSSIAEMISIKADGYTYGVTKKNRLVISGKSRRHIYNQIEIGKNQDTGEELLLGTLNSAPAIVHYGSEENHFVSTYYTLKTSNDGFTTIDCIYRKASFSQGSTIFFPYSVCSVGKTLSRLSLRYRLPEWTMYSLTNYTYPFRVKVREIDGVSLYFYYEEMQGMPDYLVQYKDKKIIFRNSEGYILGGMFGNKNGLVKIEDEDLNGKGKIDGIDIAALKRKILEEGSPFNVDNPKVQTGQFPTDVIYHSIVY